MGDAFMRKQLEVNAQHTRSGMHLNGSWAVVSISLQIKTIVLPNLLQICS